MAEPREVLVVEGLLQCPHCGSNEIKEHLVQSQWSDVFVTMTYMVEGQEHYSLDRKSVDVQDIEAPEWSCGGCEEQLTMPENVVP